MLIGKVVSHYRVLEQIGKGGMGEVFLAEDSILDRRVALKFLTSAEDTQERSRILSEARAAASIDHPSVCKVFETCESDGRHFIVMEFVEGETLSKRLCSGPIPFPEALAMMCEIAGALAEAHSKGIIHCDLKPSNVMLTRSGHVKLMDFGLARQVRGKVLEPDDETLTTFGLVLGGTQAYMAPEQARGEDLSAAADVFSFGIMLFEVVAGEHPFKKNTAAATIAAIVSEEPPGIEHYLQRAHPSLGRILKRALAKRPAERYSSAADLATDLRTLRDSGSVPGSSAGVPVIAILPFKDLSSQRDQEYFCDGLAEELIVALGRIEELRVVSRSAAFRYRTTDLSLSEIGSALKATAILEGSVRKAGDRLRVVLNLLNLENGRPIWSERFDSLLDDIFAIQDQISQAIAEKLRVTFSAPVRAGLPGAKPNMRAYEAYLRGRHFWNKRSEESLRLSIDQFRLAIAEEPAYAQAHAGLADAWVSLAMGGASPPSEVIPLARRALDRALSLNPDLPEALTCRACVRAIHDWDWIAAELEFESVIRRHPRVAQSRQWFAMNCLSPRGRNVRAAEELKRAFELEPVSPVIATSLGVLEFFEGKYEAAISRFRAVLELDDGFYLAHYFLGQAYLETTAREDALRELECAVLLTGRSSESLSALGYTQASVGMHTEALETLRELTVRRVHSYVSPVLLAQVQIGLGQLSDAVASLEEAVLVRAADLIWLGVRPAFKTIRSNSRVAAILAEMGLGTMATST